MYKDTHSDIATWNDHDFRAFIKENAAVFHVFAAKYIKDEDTINEILQESLIKLWVNRKKIGELKSPRNYFYAIIKNTIVDHWQNAAKEKLEDMFRHYDNIADSETFFWNMIEAESAHLIVQAIKTLSPQSQKIIFMTMEGEKIKDIAEILNISVNTVKTIKYRALERLSELLSKEDLLLLCVMVGGIGMC